MLAAGTWLLYSGARSCELGVALLLLFAVVLAAAVVGCGSVGRLLEVRRASACMAVKTSARRSENARRDCSACLPSGWMVGEGQVLLFRR